RPHQGDLERAAARVRPRSRAVPQRVPAELGDRGPCDLLRIEIHERRPGAGQLPHPGARGGSRGRGVAVAVGRAAVHALGRRNSPIRVRQPLPLFSGRRGSGLGGAALYRGVDCDWVGATLVVAQLDFVTRWRIRSDLSRGVPGGAWHRATRGARLVAPAGGGGRLAAVALGPATGTPTLPVPPGPPGAVWDDVALSPDGRWVAGSRSADGRRALVRWPADSPAAGTVLVETRGSIADPVWTPRGE